MEQQVASPSVSPEPFSFSGTAAEYFRIWIVNLCLTIVTVGIYSPWAKVRNTRYLYRNTHLAAGSFDYHANPVAILKGRLLAVVMLGAYFATALLAPGLDALVFVAIACFIPWLLVRSRMFSLRNTSYRNIRFSFRPVFGEAYAVLIGYYLIAVASLGLAFPWARYHRARLLVDNSRFGASDLRISDEVTAGNFYKIYIGIGVLLAVAFFVAVYFGFALSSGLMPEGPGGATDPESPEMSRAALLFSLPLIPVYFTAFYAISAAVLHRTLAGMRIGEHRLSCDFSVARLVWIRVTNLFAILLSLGLLIPWATVRTQRYILSGLTLHPAGDLDAMLAGEAVEVSALGEEIGEAFDFDFGL